MASNTSSQTDDQIDDQFSKEVLRLRAEYEHCRLSTNLYPPGGRPLLELDLRRGDKSYMMYWYEDGTEHGQCVRVFDVPGTLSGDILRLHRNLPPMSGHFEVDGDDVRPLDRCLEYPELEEDDSENVSAPISGLPLVCVDPAKHFVKKAKYRSEVENLAKCQGGSVPGHPLSQHVVQLLGRSADGGLVFEKLLPIKYLLGRFSDLATYRRWILHLVDALDCLHSVGIVHRDLRTDNLLCSPDGERLVICDLEGRWGQRSAPEVAFQGGLDDSGWSPRTDIFDVGNCIQGMVYANAPITNFVEWPVPPPLQAVVEACQRPDPAERPTLAELRVMVGELRT